MRPAANDHALDALICAALRGEAPAWPADGDSTLADGIFARAHYHGVTVLLAEHVGRLPGWPPTLREAVKAEAVARHCWEAQHRLVIGEALAALRGRGIEAVAIKGTGLAYTLYGEPAWRIRADSDLIVAEGDGERAANVLRDVGFMRSGGVSMTVASHQDDYVTTRGGNQHTIDLHRRLANQETISRLLTYEELRGGAVPAPALGRDALVAGPVHALAIACLHRATHRTSPYYVDGTAHYDGDRLIWLYDIHLLAGSLSAADWRELALLATSKGLGATCLDGLDAASARLGTTVPAGVRGALDQAGEPLARYLASGPLAQGWQDLAAIRGASGRLRFLREVVLPPASYMRAKYRDAGFTWLPWLYGRRALGGIARRLRAGR